MDAPQQQASSTDAPQIENNKEDSEQDEHFEGEDVPEQTVEERKAFEKRQLKNGGGGTN